MPMRFKRNWDFDPGNKSLDLNSLTQDKEVIQALRDALDLAVGGAIASQSVYDPAFSGLSATNVQDALDELDQALDAQIAHVHEGMGGGGASTAEEVSYDNTVSGLLSTEVQGAIDQLMELIGEAGDGTAVTTTFTPAGGLASTNVQDALAELDSEKAATGHTHAAAPDPATYLLGGIHSARPAPGTVPAGAVYRCSTHACEYQAVGGAWTLYGSPGIIRIALGGAVPADTPAGTIVLEALT